MERNGTNVGTCEDLEDFFTRDIRLVCFVIILLNSDVVYVTVVHRPAGGPW